MKHKVKLYQFEGCPFCAKVREKLEELGIVHEKENAPRDRDSDTRKMLAVKSGVGTIPVIEIDGNFIGDSKKIIEELEKMNKKGEFK